MVRASESKTCSDCANLHSLCDVCVNMDRWKSMDRKKNKTETAEDVPKTPVAHEDGTIEGTITNPEALDALERCKCHGGTVELKDGVLFCTTCGLAVPHPLPVASLKCSECDSVDTAERCIYCDGDPNEDRAGDKFIPEGSNKDEPEEAPAGVCIDADGNQVVVDDNFLWPLEEDCRGCIHLDDEARVGCQGCEPGGDEAGNPTHYEPSPISEDEQQSLVPVDAPNEPWWHGGPLDTVDGMPWHTAVLKLPAGEYMILTEGRYNYGGVEATTTRPTILKIPTDPDTVISGMLLLAEQDAKFAAAEESRMEYKPGHNGQSTLNGEPLVRGSIERTPVVQICVTVDKFLLRTTEEGMEKALERAEDKGPMELEQWIYRKMRPIGKETLIGKDDWAEGMRQLRKVIEEAI